LITDSKKGITGLGRLPSSKAISNNLKVHIYINIYDVDTPSGTTVRLRNMASQKNRGNEVRGFRKKNTKEKCSQTK